MHIYENGYLYVTETIRYPNKNDYATPRYFQVKIPWLLPVRSCAGHSRHVENTVEN